MHHFRVHTKTDSTTQKKIVHCFVSETCQFGEVRSLIKCVAVRCQVELAAVVEGHVQNHSVLADEVGNGANLLLRESARSGIRVRAGQRARSHLRKRHIIMFTCNCQIVSETIRIGLSTLPDAKETKMASAVSQKVSQDTVEFGLAAGQLVNNTSGLKSHRPSACSSCGWGQSRCSLEIQRSENESSSTADPA